MKYKLRKNNAFTLIELMVALGILAIVILFSSEIFKVSIDSQRVALANAEIMQKFRAITNQLNSDFGGLDKDGEILVAWKATPVQDKTYTDNDLDGYERFDEIMFFANGDFQSYNTYPVIRGNMARICYTIAKQDNTRPEVIKKPKRILTRTQHILTDDQSLPDNFDPNSYNTQKWLKWNNIYQYDKISMWKWKLIPINNKIDTLSFILDVNIKLVNKDGQIIYQSQTDKNLRGVSIDTSDPNSMHMLLCDGVGEFKIQGWDNIKKTWVPEVDPDGDGKLGDSNFFLNDPDPNNSPSVLYSWPINGVNINNIDVTSLKINRENFNSIPGLGRALKFTFTLFDSRGIIREGRTFTHIVYLDK
jgi:prepilin-type N-terminal cleavage/methylation domain-containing protein